MLRKILGVLILAFITAEIFAAIYIYTFSRKIVYFQGAVNAVSTLTQEDKYVTNFRIHPYLGYLLKPGIKLSDYLNPERIKLLHGQQQEPTWLGLATNNYGYFSPYNYPYVPLDDQEFIVGIFGGSVAHWLAVQGIESLTNNLSNGIAKNRKIRILNYASGGYKQPQTIISLVYFLSLGQRFDVVINIDGFNESALTEKNISSGVSPFMPSIQHMNALANLIDRGSLNSEYLKKVVNIINQKELAESWQQCRDNASLAITFFICELLSEKYFRFIEQSRAEADILLRANLSNTDLIWMLKEDKSFNDSIIEIAGNWVNSSLLMHTISKSYKSDYLHVLQPNQYVSNKNFSELEKQIAFADNPPYSTNNIINGYKTFQAKSVLLKENGVRYFDATRIFDNVDEIVFSDSCCHLNQLGNDFFAKNIVKTLK